MRTIAIYGVVAGFCLSAAIRRILAMREEQPAG
jgi:hypothetical protein